jgi:hypothetical protein
MDDYPFCPGLFSQQGDEDRVRLIAPAGLAERGKMIDINGKLHWLLLWLIINEGISRNGLAPNQVFNAVPSMFFSAAAELRTVDLDNKARPCPL